MSTKTEHLRPPIYPYLNTDSLYRNIKRQIGTGTNLESKYLYLGWHGAQAWKEVDSSYKISTIGVELVKTYYSAVDDIVRQSSKNGNYTIISLGSGICEEDKCIIDVLHKKDYDKKLLNSTVDIITVDISIDLLLEGRQNLLEKVRKSNELKKIVRSIASFNTDIENLIEIKDQISRHKRTKSDPCLFHLLGLTLGNNSETVYLKSIYNTMNVNDYLLLGVDFCADDNSMLSVTQENYFGNKITKVINKYLLSPLQFALSYDENRKRFSFGGYTSVEIEFMSENNISDIPDSTSFVYYYKFKKSQDTKKMRVCYSNKYKSNEFRKYIEETMPKQGVYFQIVNSSFDYRDDATKQCLILLKKVNNEATGKGDDIESSPDLEKIKSDAMSLLTTTILEMSNRNVKTRTDSDAIQKLNQLKMIIQGINDKAKLTTIKGLIKNARQDNTLQNSDTISIIFKIANGDE